MYVKIGARNLQRSFGTKLNRNETNAMAWDNIAL